MTTKPAPESEAPLVVLDTRAASQPPETALVSTTQTPIDRMLALAADPNFDAEKMRLMLQMHRELDADQARRSYAVAMGKLRAELPIIGKSSTVKFPGKQGKADTSYNFASLATAVRATAKLLSGHGLSLSWQTEQPDKGTVKVTCVCTHEQGHAERIALQGPIDTSGNKNALQAIGSAVTYLERYTMFALLGLASEEQDDDARGTHPPRSNGNGGKSGQPPPLNAETMIAELKGASITSEDLASAWWDRHRPDIDRLNGESFTKFKRVYSALVGRLNAKGKDMTEAQRDRFASFACDPLAPDTLRDYAQQVVEGKAKLDRAKANEAILRGKAAIAKALTGRPDAKMEDYVAPDKREAKDTPEGVEPDIADGPKGESSQAATEEAREGEVTTAKTACPLCRSKMITFDGRCANPECPGEPEDQGELFDGGGK